MKPEGSLKVLWIWQHCFWKMTGCDWRMSGLRFSWLRMRNLLRLVTMTWWPWFGVCPSPHHGLSSCWCPTPSSAPAPCSYFSSFCVIEHYWFLVMFLGYTCSTSLLIHVDFVLLLCYSVGCSLSLDMFCVFTDFMILWCFPYWYWIVAYIFLNYFLVSPFSLMPKGEIFCEYAQVFVVTLINPELNFGVKSVWTWYKH